MSELVTFAGPRVGDAAFASSFDAALGKQTTTNLYHDLDPVLAQNQPLWDALGFVHAGRTAAGQGGLARCPLPRLARSGPCGRVATHGSSRDGAWAPGAGRGTGRADARSCGEAQSSSSAGT